MTRLVPGLAVPILVGLPLWLGTSRLVDLVALASGALCVLAVLRVGRGLATTAASVALLALALALRETPAPPNVFMLAAFGSALLLLIEGTHFCERFAGAEVARAWWHRQIGWWVGRAAISLGCAFVIAILAPLIALSLPPPWAPLLAGIGILAAFAAAVVFVRRGTK